MSPDDLNPIPPEPPNDGGEDELRNILGEDYDAVAAPVEAGATAGTGSDRGRVAEDAVAEDALDRTLIGESAGASTGASIGASTGDAIGAPMGAAIDTSASAPPQPVPPLPPSVQPLQFGQLETGGQKNQGGIEVLLDVKLPISVELGRTDMLVKEILECGPGTVIELNKLAGEPVDVFVNGRLVAQGEVVVVDEHFGVRVTNLLSPRDRVKSLA